MLNHRNRRTQRLLGACAVALLVCGYVLQFWPGRWAYSQQELSQIYDGDRPTRQPMVEHYRTHRFTGVRERLRDGTWIPDDGIIRD